MTEQSHVDAIYAATLGPRRLPNATHSETRKVVTEGQYTALIVVQCLSFGAIFSGVAACVAWAFVGGRWGIGTMAVAGLALYSASKFVTDRCDDPESNGGNTRIRCEVQKGSGVRGGLGNSNTGRKSDREASHNGSEELGLINEVRLSTGESPRGSRAKGKRCEDAGNIHAAISPANSPESI